MESYTGFAEVYDELMDATPYGEWCQRIVEYIGKYGVSRPLRESVKHPETAAQGEGRQETRCGTTDEACISDSAAGSAGQALREALKSEQNLVLDLGCGTGTLTEMMATRGYDMIGVDLSAEMLSLAMEKRAASGLDILYINQDMRELDLYSTVGTVYSVCDSVNYLLEDADVIQAFRRVNLFLFPQGLFLFDFNTVYKYEQIGDSVIAESREDCSFIWDNYYDPDTHTNEYDLTIYRQEEDDLYRRFDETHVQRGYTLKEMQGFVKEAGLEWIEAIDADTGGEVTEVTERVFVAAREHGKA
ncbi:MAG: class I SAM-dependent methyltransferase [Lachnospiraceae bacterium]|nr:class I SAM-dependent methyltransferase [Lachnospiraceae bacterium]